MSIDSFIVNIKSKDVYNNIAKYVETRFDTLNYVVDYYRQVKIKKRLD